MGLVFDSLGKDRFLLVCSLYCHESINLVYILHIFYCPISWSAWQESPMTEMLQASLPNYIHNHSYKAFIVAQQVVFQGALRSHVPSPHPPWQAFCRTDLDPPGHKSANTWQNRSMPRVLRILMSQSVELGGLCMMRLCMSVFATLLSQLTKCQESDSRQAASAAGSFFVSSCNCRLLKQLIT